MNREQFQQVKKKIARELKEFLTIFLFLGLFFSAFAAYRALLLREFHIDYHQYYRYTAAIINAMILAKVIMVGEYAGLGKRQEHRPLIFSTTYKAFAFGLLAVAFEVIEEGIDSLIHHKRLTESFPRFHSASGRYELLASCLVMFCAFLPFFGIREMQRVLGGNWLHNLFFGKEPLSNSDISGSIALRERTSE
jgi:hypothetical protein